ncbi:hypothetical protein Ccrd_006115 [Cynara cardunculus var. scolymus]|uniref:Uncharacterized protein n=1 Tax=Cynara cardunculus var. scolymus TaxID=59895 RepID=A0A124SBW0_CYNCS|nr:hypothetical protein Ccrd_006115 [Cynara cardunculus var. scolymus]
MGKKGSNKKALPATTSGPQMSVTIREASTGKKHTNVKSSLKLQHIKNLAMWATHDASIPSLGAFFGHHFAASSEALGMPVDPSLFTCERSSSSSPSPQSTKIHSDADLRINPSSCPPQQHTSMALPTAPSHSPVHCHFLSPATTGRQTAPIYSTLSTVPFHFSSPSSPSPESLYFDHHRLHHLWNGIGA